MEWKDAVAHLPYTMMCTDKRGRILLLNRDLDGVRVGKSFLKFAASKSDILAVGRAAKESLSDGKPREVKRAEATGGEAYSVSLVPFSIDSKRADHLMVILGPVEEVVEAVTEWEPTRGPAAVIERPLPARPLQPGARQGLAVTDVKPSSAPGAGGHSIVEVSSPEAHEIVLIATAEVAALAAQLSAILGRRIKTRLWPLSQFRDSLLSRGGTGSSDDIDGLVSGNTRLIFIGKSGFSHAIAASGGTVHGRLGAHWSVLPGAVRQAAIWMSDPDVDDFDELLGDLQFEVGQISMSAIPGRPGRGVVKEIAPGLALAAAYLEDPGSSLTSDSTIEAMSAEYRLLYGIAMFLSEGLESLVS